MNENNYPDLVRSAASGDQGAITKLYNLTYNDVYKTALFLVKDEDAALHGRKCAGERTEACQDCQYYNPS